MIIGRSKTDPQVLGRRIANAIHKYGCVDIWINDQLEVNCMQSWDNHNYLHHIGRYTSKAVIKDIIADIVDGMRELEG